MSSNQQKDSKICVMDEKKRRIIDKTRKDEVEEHEQTVIE